MAVEKYSLASSINKNGRRLIAVGSGFENKREIYTKYKNFNLWFNNFDLVKISEQDKVISEVDIWLGQKNQVVFTKQDIYKTIKKSRKNRLKISS